MNVCLVLAGNEEGGLETHVVDLANGLARLGDDVTVVAHARYGPRFASTVTFSPLDLARSRRSPSLRRGLQQRIRDAAADLVHAHAGKAAALVAAADVGIPTVGTIHGMKKDLSAYRRFDAVIGVSPRVLKNLVHPNKTVIYNGVPGAPPAMTGAQLRGRFGIAPGQPVVVAVGRLVPVKGYDRLIELWDRSLGHLLLVGEGPERSRLAALAEGKPVTLAGFRSDARAIMGGADLMVFASEREGFPYALAEALVARLPVVSTPVPGAVDLLPAEHLAPIPHLKGAITRCVADLTATRDRMQSAFEHAARALNVEHMVHATRAVYATVVR